MDIRILIAMVLIVAGLPKLSMAKTVCSSATPALYFQTATSPIQYVRNQSSDILTQIYGKNNQGSVGGLGGGEIGFRTESRFEIFQRANEACVLLKSVSITFYTKPKIHIASNFKRGSCEYEAVIAHERQHVDILQTYAKARAPEAKSHIAGILRRMNPVIGPIHSHQIDKAQTAMQNGLQSHIEVYNEKILPELMERQKAIDTPQEYARVSRQCSNWGDESPRGR